MSFAKALASSNPMGVNYVVETDFYYPLYSSISELFPKDKKVTEKPTVPTTTTVPTTPSPMRENPKFDSFTGTYVDSSNIWRRKVLTPYSHSMGNIVVI